nr:hypothetical protein [Bacillus cytotoxicus]
MSFVIRKFPANSFVRNSAFDIGGAGGHGTSHIIDKGAKQPIFLCFCIDIPSLYDSFLLLLNVGL